jgi:polyphosphate glucokinase
VAFHPDDVFVGVGNLKKLTRLPPGCRRGANANAFLGGFRLWEDANDGRPSMRGNGRTK